MSTTTTGTKGIDVGLHAIPVPIYANGSAATDTESKAAQLRQLALIGIAATDTAMNLNNLEGAFQGLFEVMHRLAGEVEEEVEDMRRLAAKVAGTGDAKGAA
jgi:hypothetical protein